MLLDCRQSLAERAIDHLFVSTHSQRLHETVVGQLKAAGCRVEVASDDDNETAAHDGLVFASSPSVPALLETFRPFGRVEIAQATPAGLVRRLAERGALPAPPG